MVTRRMSGGAAWLVLAIVVGAALVAWWLPRRGAPAPAGSSRAAGPSAAGSSTAGTASSPPSRSGAAGRASGARATSRAPWQGTVVHVVDGDTADVRAPRGVVRVRLLGIDAPEMAHGSPAQCGATASTRALRGRLQGRAVRVVPDAVGDTTDRYGRALAYVETIEGPGRTVDAGAEQLRAGMAAAWFPSSATRPTRDASYRALVGTARASSVGNWASCAGQGR